MVWFLFLFSAETQTTCFCHETMCFCLRSQYLHLLSCKYIRTPLSVGPIVIMIVGQLAMRTQWVPVFNKCMKTPYYIWQSTKKVEDMCPSSFFPFLILNCHHAMETVEITIPASKMLHISAPAWHDHTDRFCRGHVWSVWMTLML